MGCLEALPREFGVGFFSGGGFFLVVDYIEAQ